MLEVMSGLSWPSAFAIVGSVVTIVIGLFGYLKNKPTSTPASPKPSPSIYVTREEIDNLHSRISSAKDVAMENKGELKIMANHLKAIEKQMAEHERRDIADFKLMQQKIDKMMDIVIQILQDDKL